MVFNNKTWVAAVMMTVAGIAQAVPSYKFINWCVDGSARVDEFSYATVRAGSEYLYVYDPIGGSTGSTMLYADEDGMAGPVYSGTIAADYVGSLRFEIWNDDDESFESFVVNYADWNEYAYLDMGTAGATPLELMLSIPEPTSGLLMLLGVAGLCLRRKQRGCGQ